MASQKGSSLETMVSFLLGAATGFILGVLFAPASGKETRKVIKQEMAKTGEKAKEGYERISKEAEKGFKVVKEKTTEGIGAIREFIDKKKSEIQKKGKAETTESE